MSPASQAATQTGQLPLESTGFVGRQAELATLGSPLSRSRLVVSRRTVDSHVEHIFGKVGVSSRVRLALWFRQQAAL